MLTKIKEKNCPFKRKYPNYDKKLKKKILINYLKCELRSSTTHGLPYVVNNNLHWSERWFWAISFLSCSSLAVVLLRSQYSRYIETPIVMSVEMDYFNWNVSYPAFTLCPFLKPQDNAWNARLNETFEKYENNLESYYWDIIHTSIETGIVDTIEPELQSLINPDEYANIAAELFLKFDNSSITTNTNWPVSVEAIMTEVGMCHVFNSNVAKYDNPRNWNKNSITMKYKRESIVLSVHDRDFFAQLMNYADVYKIYIHSPDEVILATTPSYLQSDKGFLSFGVKVWSTRISDELRHSSIKLRKCRFVNEPMSKRYPVYSYNHCMLECRIKMIIELCGCIPHYYRPLPKERICEINELSCIITYNKEIRTLSTSKETARKFHDSKNLPKSPKDCDCMNSCEGEKYMKDFDTFLYQPSVNRLRIGISSFPKVRVVRDAILSLSDIVLRRGGVVNLCIGTSFISLLELIMIPLRIIICNLKYYKMDKMTA